MEEKLRDIDERLEKIEETLGRIEKMVSALGEAYIVYLDSQIKILNESSDWKTNPYANVPWYP